MDSEREGEAPGQRARQVHRVGLAFAVGIAGQAQFALVAEVFQMGAEEAVQAVVEAHGADRRPDLAVSTQKVAKRVIPVRRAAGMSE